VTERTGGFTRMLGCKPLTHRAGQLHCSEEFFGKEIILSRLVNDANELASFRFGVRNLFVESPHYE